MTWLDTRALADDIAYDPHSVRLESLVLLAALAPLTQSIGLIAQMATQHVQPYMPHLLRMGVRFVSMGTDLSFLLTGATQQVGLIRTAESAMS